MTFLAGSSIFLAAFLLFALEPLVAKRILPWFGGSSAVWSVCLVFYQVALLAGYFYASVLARSFRQSKQVFIHITLLGCSLLLLPIGPSLGWKPGANDNPAWKILLMLTASTGLPFAMLSATSPLLQDWLSRASDTRPYRLFALSNVASLTALLAYPLLIETHLDATQQSVWWSAGFALFVVLCSAFAWQTRCVADASPVETRKPLAMTQKVYWLALSACGSMLLLSVTNHIDENVAAVPLLWVLPLAVYLVTFVVAFGSGFYRRELWLRVLAFGLAMLAYAAYDIETSFPIQLSVPVFLAGLFIGCLFCQGELYRLKPDNAHLTAFYLAIAAGGAAGAVFVGLVAPHLFGGIYELPLSLTMAAALALALTWRNGGWSARLLWSAVTASMAVVFVLNWQAYNKNALALQRSFYGSLRVLQSQQSGPKQTRALYHGTVQHGAEYIWPPRRLEPTTYYGENSAIGIVLREWPVSAKRVGVVGLGAGTLAAYGEPGDTFRFYEINPQVIQLAKQFFFFLADSRALVEMVKGDARLSLEREHAAPYDVLVLDAFSGDAIPVHLLTREAMALYVHRLRPNGVIAFHVSNSYLDLPPVIKQLADSVGSRCLVVRNEAEQESMVLASEWVLVTRNEQILDNDVLKMHSVALPAASNMRIWTDDFNSLLPILKTPEVR